MLPNYDKVEGLGILSVCNGILKIEALGTKRRLLPEAASRRRLNGIADVPATEVCEIGLGWGG